MDIDQLIRIRRTYQGWTLDLPDLHEPGDPSEPHWPDAMRLDTTTTTAQAELAAWHATLHPTDDNPPTASTHHHPEP